MTETNAGTGSGADLKNRRWKLSGQPCVSQPVGSQTAVFDALTGETFLLNDLPALILGVLTDRPVRRSYLIEQLAGPVRLESGEDLRFDEALAYLENADLAVSCGPDMA